MTQINQSSRRECAESTSLDVTKLGFNPSAAAMHQRASLDKLGRAAYVPTTSSEVMDMTARLHTVEFEIALQLRLSSEVALDAYLYASGL